MLAAHRWLLAIGISLVVSGPGCSSMNMDDSTCAKGQTCSCTGAGSCMKHCKEGGCNLQCTGAGACEFMCDGGNCNVTATGAGATTLSCMGGGCTMTCSGTGSCELLKDCPKNCALTCAGTGTCNNYCTDPSCTKK